MNKVICAPEALIPQDLSQDIIYFSTFSNPHRDNIGYFGPSLKKDLERDGLTPSITVWDFATIALSIAAADNSISRKISADGWTRQIDLTIHLNEPAIWEQVKIELQNVFKFLTGDYWVLHFMDGGVAPPVARRSEPSDFDCVSLLSGGLDSLIGSVDLVSEGRKPIFVSQIVKGDAETQRIFANKIRAESPHFQWSHKIHVPKGKSEGSTRGRSIIFLAFAALASTAIDKDGNEHDEIFVPENGFISLNIPLNSGRLGSYSTKTTHPIFISGLQDIWSKVSLNKRLVLPYQFKTKGELIMECKDQDLLKSLINSSTSCGKYLRYSMQHCGRCVPCLVRRAAFLKAGLDDTTTKGYKFEHLRGVGRYSGPNDVGAMAVACLKLRQSGLQSIVSGSLSFATTNNRGDYFGVISRGFSEIESLLNLTGVF